MSDIASLGIKVDSEGAVIAIKSLEHLAQVSAEAEKAAEKLGGATKQQAKQFKELDKAAKAAEITERRHIDQSLERARAYTKIASAEVAAMQAAERNKSTVRQMAEEQKKLKDGLGKLLAAIDPLESKLNKLDEAEKKLHETFRAGVIEAEKYAETLAKIGAQRNEIVEKQLKEIGEGAGFASEMIKRLGLNSRESQRDLLNLGRAAASGNWTQAQASVFQLARGSSALSLALSGVGVSIGAVTAGVGVLGYMYYQSYRENQEFNRSLALTGNAASTTTERLTAMSRSIGESIAYAADTAKVVQDVARTGKIAADSIEEVALASVQMQQAFGQAVDQTIREFVRLGEAPSTALLELNDKYHHLTFSVYEQVRALEEQGREEEAMALAQRHHSEQLNIRANEVIANIGAIESAYLKAKKNIQATWQTISDGIANLGKEEPITDVLAGLREELRQQEAFLQEMVSAGERTGRPNLELIAQTERNIQAIKMEVTAFDEGRQKLETIDQLEGEIEKERERRLKQSQDQRKYLEQNQPNTLEHELQKARENVNRLTEGLSKGTERYKAIMEAFYREEAEIRKRHEKKSPKGSSGTNTFAAEAARLKARIQEETALAEATERTVAQVSRLNEFERRALQLRELAKNETKAVNKAKLEELATLNEQAGALVRTNKLTEEAAKERLRYLDGIEKTTKKTQEEAQKLRDQAQTMGMSKAAFEALTTARLQEQIAQLQGKEGTEEEIQLLKEQLVARQELTAAIGEHDTARIAHEAQKEVERDWQKTMDNMDDVFRRGFADMINGGKSSWKSFTKSLTTTFKTAVADEIYKMFMKPFVAQVAVGVGGMFGMGGAANAKGGQGAAMGFDVLRGAHSAYSAFTGGLTSTLSNGIGYLGEMFGSSALQSFSAGMAGTVAGVTGSLAGIGATGGLTSAAALGSTIGTGAIASPAFAASVGGGSLGGAAGMGAAFGAAMPWLAGGLAVAALLPSITNAFKGETRGGGYYQLQDGAVVRLGGASGGDGGQQTLDALTTLFSSAQGSIDGLFNELGINASVAFYHGMFEDSKKGRGGVFSGGILDVGGQQINFGTNQKGAGYGGKSGSLEEMFENLQKDLAFSTLEAWQSVSDQMPNVLQSMLKDIDVRSLSAEQAQASVQQIQLIVGAVGQLTTVLNQLPMMNLQNLAFDAVAGVTELFGGADQAIAGIGGYYQNFYSEAERTAHTIHLLTAEFGKLGYELPASRDALRDIVDGIDLSTREGQELYMQLLQLAPTFASVTEEAGGFGLALGELGELMQLLASLPFNHLRDMGEETVRVLADLSGGVEAFSHNLSAYYQGFFSEQERFVSASAMLVTDLSDLGLSLPATASGFRAMMDSIDLTTQAGQELFAALLGTADQAVSHYQYVEQQVQGALAEVAQAVAQARQAELTELKASQNQRLQALREEQKKATQAVRDSYAEQVKSVRDSIGSINDKLRELGSISNRVGAGIEALRSYSDLAVELHRNASRKLVDEAVRLAQAGQSLVGFTGLEDAISAVSRLEASDFTSLFEFELERAETVSRLKELESLTGGQIDVQELQLSAMEKQLENLDEWRDKQFSLLENQFERRQQTLESIFQKEQDALNQHFEVLLKQEQEAVERQVTEMLTMQANQAALGHIVESTSLQQYSQLVSIESAIDASASRIASAVSNIRVTVDMGLPAFADGGHYGGGLALVGERGPEIINFAKPGMVYTAAQTRSLMASGGDTSELVGLLRQLIAMTTETSHEMRAVALGIAQVLGILRDVSQGGTELRTVVTNKKEVTV